MALLPLLLLLIRLLDGGSTLKGAGATYGDVVVLLLSWGSVGVGAGVFLSRCSIGVDGWIFDDGGFGDITAVNWKFDKKKNEIFTLVL